MKNYSEVFVFLLRRLASYIELHPFQDEPSVIVLADFSSFLRNLSYNRWIKHSEFRDLMPKWYSGYEYYIDNELGGDEDEV